MSTNAPSAGQGWWRQDCLVALVLGMLLAAAWIGSALSERRDLESQLPLLFEEVTRKLPMAVNVDVLKQQRDEIKEILAVTERQFPASFDADSLQSDLARQADSQGLELVGIVRGEETLRQFFGELDFEINLRGPSGSVYVLLENLTMWLPIKQVRALDLRAEDARTDVLTAKLKVVYFRSVDLHEDSHGSAR